MLNYPDIIQDNQMTEGDMQKEKAVKTTNGRTQVEHHRPFVILSDFTADHTAKKSLEIGAYDFINNSLYFSHVKDVMQQVKKCHNFWSSCELSNCHEYSILAKTYNTL